MASNHDVYTRSVMAVLVGIDEAGYGPLLGPMLVSSAGFAVPDRLLKGNMWDCLTDSLGKSRSKLSGRLLVNDSKQAYTKELGILHLQRTSLAFLKVLGKQPKNLAALVEILCPDCLARLAQYNWYKDLDARKLDFDPCDLAVAASVLEKDLKKNKIELLWLKSCCLDVMHYNKLVDAARNKSTVLFNTAAILVQHAFDNSQPTLQIVVDRQGGRADYAPGLRRMFPDSQLTVIRQDQEDSSYELAFGSKSLRIHFVVGADDRFLPVSLASMVCKYLRELLNECMNDYFLKLCPELTPTAGYWQDGTRFVEQLRRLIPDFDQYSPMLIRVK